jgi:hypothetical protein
MLVVARRGWPDAVLESRDIVRAASRDLTKDQEK